eukprot:3883771-Amphidinium_carterae.1
MAKRTWRPRSGRRVKGNTWARPWGRQYLSRPMQSGLKEDEEIGALKSHGRKRCSTRQSWLGQRRAVPSDGLLRARLQAFPATSSLTRSDARVVGRCSWLSR